MCSQLSADKLVREPLATDPDSYSKSRCFFSKKTGTALFSKKKTNNSLITNNSSLNDSSFLGRCLLIRYCLNRKWDWGFKYNKMLDWVWTFIYLFNIYPVFPSGAQGNMHKVAQLPLIVYIDIHSTISQQPIRYIRLREPVAQTSFCDWRETHICQSNILIPVPHWLTFEASKSEASELNSTKYK